MTDNVIMKRVFAKDYYLGDSTVGELAKMVQVIQAENGADAEVYLEDEALSVYINRPETDHEREVRIKNEERVKNYRYNQYLELKKEFEGPDYGGKVPSPLDKSA
jgi:hypothetical protein